MVVVVVVVGEDKTLAFCHSISLPNICKICLSESILLRAEDMDMYTMQSQIIIAAICTFLLPSILTLQA